MTDAPQVLTFAVVGHPNEGKSSVVSTLTEDDTVRITPLPGETVVCRSFPVIIDGREMLRFVDTPGFQSPRATLEWLQAHAGPDMLASFLRQNAGDPRFSGELELFRPLAEGAEIIYVLDASRPLRSIDIAEMEILRMTGIPRMAVINAKEDDEQYITAWRDELRRHFNAVRIFNALRATYAERIGLLASLKSIDQEWEVPLGRVIEALEDDWLRRITQTALLIAGLIAQAVTYQVSRSFSPEQEQRVLRDELTREYREHITGLERRTHLEIRRHFKHNIFDCRLPGDIVQGDDLFEEKTWRMLGLSPIQVAAAGAVAGGGIGLGLDAIAGGSSLGAFALVGGLLGAGTALLGGRRMISYKVTMPRLGPFRFGTSIGDYLLTVGPNRNTQFPYVLLDRALIFFSRTINWAHARREVSRDQDEKPEGLVAHFTDTQIRACRAFFEAAGTGDDMKLQGSRESFVDMIVDLLMSLSSREYRYGRGAHDDSGGGDDPGMRP